MEKDDNTLPSMYECIEDYKIKKHKPQWYDELIIRLNNELKEVKDFRSKVLILHLYIEYWINEIIRVTYKSPGIVIDDEELGSFGNKIKILKSRNLINYKDLLINLKQIQEIRNHYSHTLLMKDELDQKIKDKIESMKMLYIRKDLDLSKKPFEERFIICAWDTLTYLDKLNDYICDMIPRPF